MSMSTFRFCLSSRTLIKSDDETGRQEPSTEQLGHRQDIRLILAVIEIFWEEQFKLFAWNYVESCLISGDSTYWRFLWQDLLIRRYEETVRHSNRIYCCNLSSFSYITFEILTNLSGPIRIIYWSQWSDKLTGIPFFTVLT